MSFEFDVPVIGEEFHQVAVPYAVALQRQWVEPRIASGGQILLFYLKYPPGNDLRKRFLKRSHLLTAIIGRLRSAWDRLSSRVFNAHDT